MSHSEAEYRTALAYFVDGLDEYWPKHEGPAEPNRAILDEAITELVQARQRIAELEAEVTRLHTGLERAYDYAARLREMNYASLAVELQAIVEEALEKQEAS